MKIWATTVSEDKITRNIVWEGDNIYSEEDLVSALQNICEQMDVPTPISTQTNFLHVMRFNTTKYRARDFVESVDFDYLNLEIIPDKK